MRSYSQMREVCSQALYDEETQSYYVESQSNESETEAPTKLGFQTEFLKSLGVDQNDIPKYTNNSKSIQEQSNQHEPNSQTDVEMFITPHITDNPYWSGFCDPKKVKMVVFNSSE